MKILMTAVSETWGGQEDRLFSEAVWLRAKGHEVLVACMPESQVKARCTAEGIPTVNVPMKRQSLLSGMVKIGRILSQFRPDVIHTRDSRDTWRCAPFQWMGWPTVRSRHWLLTPIPRGYRQLVWKCASTHLIAAANNIRHQMVEGMGVRPDRVDVIGEGVDLREFAPGPRGGLRGQWGIPDDAILFGYVARLSGEKGPFPFVKAAGEVFSQCPNARFVMVGDDRPGDDTTEKLQALALKLFGGEGSPLHFAGWRSDIPAIMRELDVLVVPSKLDGQTRVIPQAFATGVPAIGSRVGGLPDLIRPEESGLLVAPMDVGELAGAMVRMVRDPELRERLGRSALDQARKTLSFDLRMEELLQAYSKAISRKRP